MSQGGALSGSGGGGSGVTSVTGTTNRITAIPTTGAVVVDIASTYIGQTSITTLGTITTGTWNGSVIGPTFGGTGQSTYATGDMLYAPSANTLTKLNVVPNSVILTDATIPNYPTPPTHFGTLQWFEGIPSINTMRRNIFLYDDFLGGIDYSTSNKGTGSSGYFLDVFNSQGQRQGRTGSDTDAVASFSMGGRGSNGYRYGNASKIYWETLVTFDQVGDGTDNFRCYFGIHDGNQGTPSPFAGFYLGYDYNVDPVNWICYTTNNNVTTSTITSVPVTVQTDWNRIAFTFDATVPNVQFFINDVLVATHTTNIPDPVNVAYGPNWLIEKTAGTANLPFFADYYIWNIIMPSDR